MTVTTTVTTTVSTTVTTLTSWSPPLVLDPSPAQGRDWVEQELHRSDYQSPFLESVIQWVMEQLGKLLDGARQLAEVSPYITVALALVVVALLAWVLPRVRREAVVPGSNGAVLEDPTITAGLYRDRTARALREGLWSDAVLDGFRAIAKDMSDRTFLDDAPGRTAHEVSLALAPAFPDHADRLAEAADLFDAVRYGSHQASEEQAREVQVLDTALAATRPVRSAPMLQNGPA